jgi:hypothetical protein
VLARAVAERRKKKVAVYLRTREFDFEGLRSSDVVGNYMRER